ncbi:hypothetical protein OP10G_4091 [Fimbriimonas ginsengisoli Gsoil 348]|uniref:B box-type domain-containing protein n=1 Tax=Fimbriimonas ginsengisoli Gsoil 348 TaxID=661478 RepID=A0A068NYV0_FIMGI|nr:hypothetical protein OP10G_4091 [Fimbriimonas ginsengisoli Gsoil 348]
MEAEAPGKFCANCGVKFVARKDPVSAGEDGAYFCPKHPKEVTRVTCGRCEKPICHRCIVMSPAGVRCRDCARNKRPVRVRGVLHNAAHAIGPMDQKKVWYLYILAMIARLFGGWWR